MELPENFANRICEFKNVAICDLRFGALSLVPITSDRKLVDPIVGHQLEKVRNIVGILFSFSAHLSEHIGQFLYVHMLVCLKLSYTIGSPLLAPTMKHITSYQDVFNHDKGQKSVILVSFLHWIF